MIVGRQIWLLRARTPDCANPALITVVQCKIGGTYGFALEFAYGGVGLVWCRQMVQGDMQDQMP